jgi:hypothetical protein
MGGFFLFNLQFAIKRCDSTAGSPCPASADQPFGRCLEMGMEWRFFAALRMTVVR